MKTTLFAVLILPCLALADSSPNSEQSPQLEPPKQQVPYDPVQILQVMTVRLKLTPTQQDKIKPILIAEAEKRKTIQEDTNLSDKQKHDQIGAVHRAACQKIKAFFTPEELALIENEQNLQSPTSPPDASEHAPSATSAN